MRSYMFTEKERETINAFLRGQALPSLTIARLKHRIRSFKQLESDVELYLKIRQKFTQS